MSGENMTSNNTSRDNMLSDSVIAKHNQAELKQGRSEANVQHWMPSRSV